MTRFAFGAKWGPGRAAGFIPAVSPASRLLSATAPSPTPQSRKNHRRVRYRCRSASRSGHISTSLTDESSERAAGFIPAVLSLLQFADEHVLQFQAVGRDEP